MMIIAEYVASDEEGSVGPVRIVHQESGDIHLEQDNDTIILSEVMAEDLIRALQLPREV